MIEAGQVWQVAKRFRSIRGVEIQPGTVLVLRMRMAGIWWLAAVSPVEDTVVSEDELTRYAQQRG